MKLRLYGYHSIFRFKNKPHDFITMQADICFNFNFGNGFQLITRTFVLKKLLFFIRNNFQLKKLQFHWSKIKSIRVVIKNLKKLFSIHFNNLFKSVVKTKIGIVPSAK